MVSPISTSGKPATTNRSPADSSSTSLRLTPSNAISWAEAALQRRLALGELLLEQRDGLATAHHAVDDAADGQAAEVLAGVEVVTIACSGAVGSPDRRRDGLEDRCRAAATGRRRRPGMPMPSIGPALAGDGRDDLEVDVVVAGVEVDEQLVDLVEHLVGAGVAAVDLVDDDDRRQVEGERLLQHVAGLRQRALGGVDQQQHTVDHGQGPLDLAAEVGVAGRVDQVDLDALPGDRGGLGEDGDAPLALLVVGVHDAVDHRLVGGEGAGGAQQRVDEGGLAVVDVRDEGDIAEVVVMIRGLLAATPGSGRPSAESDVVSRPSSSSSSSSNVTPYFSASAAYSSSSRATDADGRCHRIPDRMRWDRLA